MARPNKPWYRTSKGTWYARIAGKMTSLGVRGRESRKEAEAVWHKLMSESPPLITPPKPEPTPTPTPSKDAGLSVQELADKFLADAKARLKSSSLNWYLRTLNGLADQFGSKQVADLQVEEIDAWLRRTGWGDTTRNHAVGILRVAFRWAERRRLTTSDPTRFLTKPPKKSRGGDAVLSGEEHAKLLAVAGPSFRPVLEVLHATGARPSEVAAITAENFDPDAACVKLADHKTSHKGKARTIYLTPAAAAILAPLRARYSSGPLLRNAIGRKWTKDAIVLAMRRTTKRAGVKATAYHYRHTFATDALSAGVPDAQVAELLGHSSTEMVNRVYGHLGQRSRILRTALNTVR